MINDSSNNCTAPFPTYLTRQNDLRIASLRYGRARRKICNVGCGLVALYNCMKRLRKPQGFAQIIADAQRLRMPWLFGFFGTKPRSLGRYFKLHGFPYIQTDSPQMFCKELPNVNAAIICTWCDKRTHGIHFFTVIQSGGKLVALNRYNADEPTRFSPNEVRPDRFICGYLLE